MSRTPTIAADLKPTVPTRPKLSVKQPPAPVNVQTFPPGYIANQNTLPNSERRGN